MPISDNLNQQVFGHNEPDLAATELLAELRLVQKQEDAAIAAIRLASAATVAALGEHFLGKDDTAATTLYEVLPQIDAMTMLTESGQTGLAEGVRFDDASHNPTAAAKSLEIAANATGITFHGYLGDTVIIVPPGTTGPEAFEAWQNSR